MTVPSALERAEIETRLARPARYELVRTLSPRLREDRSLSADIERVATAIRDGSLVEAVEQAVGAPLS